MLTQLLHRQERHTAELPIEGGPLRLDDLGALPLRSDESRALRILPRARPARPRRLRRDRRARDEDPKQFFHGLMNAELCAAELMARNSHEHPEMPWDFHVDMARQTWDEIRHAEILDRLMTTELGCHWGDYPVGFDQFRSIYALDLAGRLARFDAEPRAEPGLGAARLPGRRQGRARGDREALGCVPARPRRRTRLTTAASCRGRAARRCRSWRPPSGRSGTAC